MIHVFPWTLPPDFHQRIRRALAHNGLQWADGLLEIRSADPGVAGTDVTVWLVRSARAPILDSQGGQVIEIFKGQAQSPKFYTTRIGLCPLP